MLKLVKFLVLTFTLLKANAQLIVYSSLNLQGSSATCLVRIIYTENNIPNGLNNSIRSISLSQGFMATLAENADGTGERFSYMATKSNLQVNLALELQNKVSFIRVLRLPTTPVRKKGAGETNDTKLNDLNVTWFYDWGPLDRSKPTLEFVPMAWGRNQARPAAVTTITNRDSITHYLAFNEPEYDGQSKVPIDTAVALYKNMLSAGYRTGSPSGKESSELYYTDTFVKRATLNNLKVDFVGIHWYDWGGWFSKADSSPTAILNRLKAVITRTYNRHQLPIWITEFNATKYRPDSIHTAFMQIALPWLDSDPRVERYAYFFGNDLPSGGGNSGPLTAVGQAYANHQSVEVFPNNVYDTRTAFADTLLAAWESNVYLQGGRDSTNFSPKWVHQNMQVTQPIRRASGVDIPTTSSSNGYWGGIDWSLTDAASGESSNKFLTFKIKSTNNKAVNFHAIDKFNIRIGANGPTKFEIDYQINNGSFQFADTIIGIPAVTGNYSLGPVDLSKIKMLQNVPSTSTVTFRIIPYEASNNLGAFLIGNGTSDTEPDFTIRGSFGENNLINQPLPVKLIKFQLQRNKRDVTLTWQTKKEVNSSEYELQKSKDGLSFFKVATIKSNNTLNGSEYNFTDKNVIDHKNYYRLKIIDNDGFYVYSNILKDVLTTNSPSIEIYPSISSGETIKVDFRNINSNTSLQVIGLNGQLKKMYKLSSSNGLLELQTTTLPKGVYVVMLQQNKVVLYKKFVKL